MDYKPQHSSKRIPQPGDEAYAAYIKRRRILAIVSLTVLLLLFAALTWFCYNAIKTKVSSADEFREYMHSFGWKSRFVFLGLQVLQVVIALIPGELLEMGAGYTFGAVEGTLLCLAGVALGSSLIFWLTKKFGIKLVEIFISREKINELRFINSEKKLKRTLFFIFFIPGTPKDLLTYFAGLTRIQLHEFLLITLIARIPSVVSSTIGGYVLGIQQYSWALVVIAITGIVSIGGLRLYNQFIKHRRKTQEESPSPAFDMTSEDESPASAIVEGETPAAFLDLSSGEGGNP